MSGLPPSSADGRRALAARAEILKLARLLGRPPERLSYLEQVPADDIRLLREQVTEMLFAAQDPTLRRLAAASKLLPVALVALIGERAFGPMLSARIAGLLDPGRAIEVAARLPTGFLADVAIELDPRRAKDVIARMPSERIAEVTRELARRQEYVTMGAFVGFLSADTLSMAAAVLGDGELLRAAFVMEDKRRLAELVDILDERRLEGLLEAAREQNLWPEVIDLLAHLPVERRAELVARGTKRGEELLEPIAGAVETHGLWAELEALNDVLDVEAQDRLRQRLSRGRHRDPDRDGRA